MSIFDAILYGFVQGLTEYLPISSSAHLILFPRFLGIEDPGLTFDVFLHFGTLFSTLVYFRRDWFKVFKSLKTNATGGASWKPIVIGTIPALFAGALLNDWVESSFRGPHIIVWTLSIGGILLFLADRFAKKNLELKDVTLSKGVWVGVFQCMALIPGVSRSGATITGGRFLGLSRDAAARFSFLLSMPVTAAAVVYKMKDLDQLLNSSVGGVQLVVACVSSFVFGLVAIGGLLKLVRHYSLLSFAIYRVALAGVVYIAFL